MTCHRTHRGRIRVLALLAVSGLIAAACGGDDDSTAVQTTASPPVTEAAPSEDEVVDDAPADDGSDDADDSSDQEAVLPPGEYVIGFESLTSGPAAFAGVPLAQGARLAVKEMNESGMLGDGVTITLNERDAGGDPATAISAVETMFSDGASVVLCCGLSSVAGSLKPILANANTAGVVTSAILPGIAEPPYMYRTVLLLADPAYAELIEALVGMEELDTAVVAVTADSDGMVAEGGLWAEALEGEGVEVVATIGTNTGDTDFSGPATQIIDLDPDIVALSQLGEEATLLAKALRDRGYEGRLVTTYGISNAANYEIAGETLEGVIFPVAFTPQMTSPGAEAFTELYEAEYGEVPDVFAAQGYTSAYFALEGLKAAGSADPQAVAEALATVTEMESPYGRLVFEGGQAFLAETTTFMEWNADGTQSIWTP